MLLQVYGQVLLVWSKSKSNTAWYINAILSNSVIVYNSGCGNPISVIPIGSTDVLYSRS